MESDAPGHRQPNFHLVERLSLSVPGGFASDSVKRAQVVHQALSLDSESRVRLGRGKGIMFKANKYPLPFFHVHFFDMVRPESLADGIRVRHNQGHCQSANLKLESPIFCRIKFLGAVNF